MNVAMDECGWMSADGGASQGMHRGVSRGIAGRPHHVDAGVHAEHERGDDARLELRKKGDTLEEVRVLRHGELDLER